MKLVAIALCSVVIAGCSSSASDSVSQTESPLTGRDGTCAAQAAANHVTSVAIEGYAEDYPAESPMAGVRVCAEARDGSNPTCGTTAADGSATLHVAPCQDVRITYSMSGYLGINQLARLQAADYPVGTRMVSVAQATAAGHALGSSYDASKSQPIVTAYTPSGDPLAGVSVNADASGGIKWYLTASGTESKSLHATTANGIMGFFNADVGTMVTTATAPGKTCTPLMAVPGDAPNSAVVELIAGSIGEATFLCE